MLKEEESCFWMTEVLIVQVSSEGSRVRVRLWTRCFLCVSQINHALPTRAGCISVFLVISQRNPGQHFNLPSGDETPPSTARKVDFCRAGSIKNGSATQTRTQRWFSFFISSPHFENGSARKPWKSFVGFSFFSQSQGGGQMEERGRRKRTAGVDLSTARIGKEV